MSLHVLADHMASKGRNGDSMLVHMTPSEVHGLQALAMKHGGSLTVNPDTGLPEANFLKSLLPMLAGFALGPAGFGLVSSAMGAGAIVGGITGIATGSLSKGLMAGLGAYGGFGIGEGLTGAGADAMTRSALSVEGALPSIDNITQVTGEGYGGSAANYSDQVNSAIKAAQDTSAAMPKADLLAAGAKSAMADPLGFAKQNMLPLGMAAAPILADQMVPTTTKMAPVQSPGRIREKRWDGRQFVDVANTDAGVFNTSGRSFSDPYRGYKDGGGIVALAGGGDVIRMAGGTPPAMLTDEQLYQQTGDWNKAAALRDAQNAALAQYNATNYVQTAAIPTETTAQFVTGANQAGIGLTAPLAGALQNSGLSQAAQYALTHADIGPSANAAETYGGLAGLSDNINYLSGGLQKQIAAGTLSGQAARDQAQAEMDKYGLNSADIMRATGKTLKELFPDTVAKKVDDTGLLPVAPSGYHYENGVLVPNISSTQNTTTTVAQPTDLYTAPATSLPVGVSGNTGPSQIGGGATINPNGTITTSPRIPDIPVGGFTGSKNLRDTYEKGGGSLGYTSPTFKTIEDFNAKYLNRMGGDSRAAYDYLTGKGGAAYPVKSGVGQISRPYDEAVLGYPARGNLPYTYNKTTGKMDVNPDYVAPGRDAAGNVTYSMSTNDIKKSLADTPLTGQALYDWAKSNNLSAQQIADATGQPLSSVYAQFRAGAKTTAAKTDATGTSTTTINGTKYDLTNHGVQPNENYVWSDSFQKWVEMSANGGLQGYADGGYAVGGGLGSLGSYSDGGRLLRGPGDGVSDSIPATIGAKNQPARLADGEFVVPARIVSELGNGSTDAGAKKLYAMMDRVQRARGKTTGKNKVAANSRSDKYLPA